MVLAQFLFLYRLGSYNKSQPINTNIVCLEHNATGKYSLWLAQVGSAKADSELFLGSHNNVAEQTETIEELSHLVDKVDSNHLLAKRVTKAIYWYQKALVTELTEDSLLLLWVSLETLVGLEEEPKKVIPYRTSLLVPTKVVVDGKLTYRQLRSWTREFIENVYHLRNEIVHGGVFDGPSFERFVERFRSIVYHAILTILSAFTLELPTPDSLDEILTWIWDRNPDDKVAVASQ